jgi:hypothetical protein
MRVFLLFFLLGILWMGVIAAQETTSSVDENLFFDDFNYSGTDDEAFLERGWIVRSGEGWPGVPGAMWRAEGVEVVDDPEDDSNRLMQMTSATDGTPENTHQTQFCQQRKFLEGTYAARVRFSDAPAMGRDGDAIVQTFYTISPLEYDLDPDYSELDFEYLPNGGWGFGNNVFFATTWETFRPDPNWLADNTSDWLVGSFEGWHTLVVQVFEGTVTYYVDGDVLAEASEEYFPEVPMSINFNLWFINGGLLDSDEERAYVEQIDWVFHAADIVLSPEEVEEAVTEMREMDVDYVDSVPPLDPLLDSPCDF